MRNDHNEHIPVWTYLFFILMTSFSCNALDSNPTSLQQIEICLNDAQQFPGNWSLAPEEVFCALKYCTYENKLRILEFGAGESTVQLTRLLTKKGIPFEYHVFENDPDYVTHIENVTYHLYDLPSLPFHRCNEWKDVVSRYDLPQLPVFDLIIVDGPHGIARAQWYAKFKKYTKPGTVILIDDFHHFREFGMALDENYKYLTIVEYNQSPHWKIIDDGLEKINHMVGKTFNIIKIIEYTERD